MKIALRVTLSAVAIVAGVLLAGQGLGSWDLTSSPGPSTTVPTSPTSTTIGAAGNDTGAAAAADACASLRAWIQSGVDQLPQARRDSVVVGLANAAKVAADSDGRWEQLHLLADQVATIELAHHGHPQNEANRLAELCRSVPAPTN